MAKQNPNITGGNLASVQERTGACWRYKRETMELPDGSTISYEDYDNRLSDNDDYQKELPMTPVVHRR
jgi:hypothetical protein